MTQNAANWIRRTVVTSFVFLEIWTPKPYATYSKASTATQQFWIMFTHENRQELEAAPSHVSDGDLYAFIHVAQSLLTSLVHACRKLLDYHGIGCSVHCTPLLESHILLGPQEHTLVISPSWTFIQTHTSRQCQLGAHILSVLLLVVLHYILCIEATIRNFIIGLGAIFQTELGV